MIAQAAHFMLIGSAATNAKVSGRVHYTHRPQGDPLPALVVQSWHTNQDHHLKGVGLGSTYGILRVTALAATYSAAAELTTLIRNLLDGVTGAKPISSATPTPPTVNVQWLLFDDEMDLPTDHRDGQGQPLTHGRQIDFRYAITTPEPTHT